MAHSVCVYVCILHTGVASLISCVTLNSGQVELFAQHG